jgi:hypothetical protein
VMNRRHFVINPIVVGIRWSHNYQGIPDGLIASIGLSECPST